MDCGGAGAGGDYSCGGGWQWGEIASLSLDFGLRFVK